MKRWIAMRFPWLPIERVSAETPTLANLPFALCTRDGARETVVAVSRPAWIAGVRPGAGVAAARSVCAGLVVSKHDPEADARLIARFANFCQRVTPDVVLEAPDVILLECSRTAERFGGEDALVDRLRRGFLRLGHRVKTGAACHPEAARTLARAAGDTHLRAEATTTIPTLAALPLAALALPSSMRRLCASLGISRIGALLDVPRSAWTARFGADLGRLLERLVGDVEEPLRRFVPEAAFRERVEFSSPVEETTPLLFAGKRLFDLAEAELVARMAAVESVTVLLETASKGPPIRLVLRPSAPSYTSRRFSALLQHRLETLRIDVPIDAVAATFERTVPIRMDATTLFEDPSAREHRDDVARLEERLASRMGGHSILGAALEEDHRPEKAFRWSSKTQETRGTTRRLPEGPRPLLLEEPPVPLAVEEDASGRPVRVTRGPDRGPVRFSRGPETIETGWWDGADVRRRYFEIETAAGVRLWIYKDLGTGHWHRHGAFS